MPSGGSSSVKSADSGKYILEPREIDVLFGRGGLSNHHPGNEWYRRLINANKGLYKSCPKHTKMLVSKSVVQAVAQQGGRFLEKDKESGYYSRVDFKRCVDKTSQALREKETARASPDEPSSSSDALNHRQHGITVIPESWNRAASGAPDLNGLAMVALANAGLPNKALGCNVPSSKVAASKETKRSGAAVGGGPTSKRTRTKSPPPGDASVPPGLHGAQTSMLHALKDAVFEPGASAAWAGEPSASGLVSAFAPPKAGRDLDGTNTFATAAEASLASSSSPEEKAASGSSDDPSSAKTFPAVASLPSNHPSPASLGTKGMTSLGVQGMQPPSQFLSNVTSSAFGMYGLSAGMPPPIPGARGISSGMLPSPRMDKQVTSDWLKSSFWPVGQLPAGLTPAQSAALLAQIPIKSKEKSDEGKGDDDGEKSKGSGKKKRRGQGMKHTTGQVVAVCAAIAVPPPLSSEPMPSITLVAPPGAKFAAPEPSQNQPIMEQQLSPHLAALQQQHPVAPLPPTIAAANLPLWALPQAQQPMPPVNLKPPPAANPSLPPMSVSVAKTAARRPANQDPLLAPTTFSSKQSGLMSYGSGTSSLTFGSRTASARLAQTEEGQFDDADEEQPEKATKSARAGDAAAQEGDPSDLEVSSALLNMAKTQSKVLFSAFYDGGQVAEAANGSGSDSKQSSRKASEASRRSSTGSKSSSKKTSLLDDLDESERELRLRMVT